MDGETERVITRGQLETQKQGRASRAPPAGHTARNMSRGVCDCMHLVLRERSSERKSGGKDRKERKGA